ncbi:hypothetical protein AN8520.2 [Aspergillus nidulans FGSC A4]|uniref:uncharacterized protein n=1 Tax=Emericella nidulans (strain FGSC A4 / ATCC 38163 / CBS 112.46 / NRRL 194 / M139) TaxID=227321 RepID=UPI00002358B6|nr:hypothetical protein [Aspergillus nidulans FGSC A4]EAA66861.1 hypothetical protein AN8517.2 [Aspergillus nidulans FGSC A4]EAA66873.1 hypothetical protein AN8520.2 [Aspergillus nidulans FGSC A4]CBF80718.1 TPA: conserved hypothetical protein [Aspergillus nidulans FGSC A4]|eukprot:XP_681786.1 hypothetical protein AN8517.2 [Aspergillus nidulans FGSC A4]
MVNRPYANMNDLANAVAESVQKYLDNSGQARNGLFQKTNNGERDIETERLVISPTVTSAICARYSNRRLNMGPCFWSQCYSRRKRRQRTMDIHPPVRLCPLPPASPAPRRAPTLQAGVQASTIRLIVLSPVSLAKSSLTPGGWLEMQELSNPVTSDDGTLSENNPLSQWGRLLIEASKKMNRPVDNPAKYETWMREAGFVNCHTVAYNWPTNPWPADEKGKTLGLWNLYNVLQRFEEFSVALLVKVLGWEMDDAKTFLGNVKEELMNEGVHGYWPVYVVYGQKPAAPGSDVITDSE